MIKEHGIGSEEEIEAAGAVSGLVKVNLRYIPGENGEGIWAVPCTEPDKATYSETTIGNSFFVYLMNTPICQSLHLGSKIECLTNGHKRPYSKEIADKSESDYYESVKVAMTTKPSQHN